MERAEQKGPEYDDGLLERWGVLSPSAVATEDHILAAAEARGSAAEARDSGGEKDGDTTNEHTQYYSTKPPSIIRRPPHVLIAGVRFLTESTYPWEENGSIKYRVDDIDFVAPFDEDAGIGDWKIVDIR